MLLQTFFSDGQQFCRRDERLENKFDRPAKDRLEKSGRGQARPSSIPGARRMTAISAEKMLERFDAYA